MKRQWRLLTFQLDLRMVKQVSDRKSLPRQLVKLTLMARATHNRKGQGLIHLKCYDHYYLVRCILSVFFLVKANFYWFSSNGSLVFHLLHHAARHFTGIAHSIYVQFHNHGEIYPLSPHLKRLLQHRFRPFGLLMLEKQEAKYTRPKTEPYWCIPALSYVLHVSFCKYR